MNNKEAIEYLKEAQSHIDLENGGYTQEMYDAIDMAIGKLQANDEQVIGEWEERTQGFACSKCDYYDRDYYEHNFCPNCGAKMKGGRG